jgi:hypothetical protein
VPSLSANHVQLEFPKRTHLQAQKCIHGRASSIPIEMMQAVDARSRLGVARDPRVLASSEEGDWGLSDMRGS